LFSELTKISKEVAEYFSKRWYDIDNLITKNINFDLKEKSFSKGLEVWKDSEFKEFEGLV
jgi:shikimate kinase